MKLFGHPDSGHAYKVKLCLELGHIAHEFKIVDIFTDRANRVPEFRDNSRFGEVPMLLDNGEALVQSNAILIHLASKYKILGGADQATLQRCIEWLFWEANKIGLCLPQLRVAEKFDKNYLLPEAKQWVTDRYHHDVNVLETELADGRNFILGELPTIADCSLCGYLYFAEEARVTVPPGVQSWLSRIAALDGWQHPYKLMQE